MKSTHPLATVLSLVTSVALALLLVAPRATAAGEAGRAQPWTPEVVELFERLAVQDGGRVKPLHTYAGFTLLRLHGKRSLTTADGERLSPVEWLLDTLYRPTRAEGHPTFLVQNDEVIEALRLPHETKRKRDRYSYEELRPGFPRLFELAREYAKIDDAARTPLQRELVFLASSVDTFGQLLGQLDFARATIELPPSDRLRQVFAGRASIRFDELVGRLAPLVASYRELSAAPERATAELHAIARVLQRGSEMAARGDMVALFPPVALHGEAPDETTPWLTAADLFHRTFEHGGAAAAEHEGALVSFVRTVDTLGDAPALLAAARDLNRSLVGAAERMGAYRTVPLELAYYKSRALDASQVLFVLAFLLMALLWLLPRAKLLYRATATCVL